MRATSIQIDIATHDDLERSAADMGTTIGHVISLAVRSLRQPRMGAELARPLRDDESVWLEAPLV